MVLYADSKDDVADEEEVLILVVVEDGLVQHLRASVLN